ncbi:anti-sigma factor [Rhizobium rhizoryzae]|jgi:anti-sigma-K factor RskA|uniref:Anti-sigma-K factor RskA n=1 Tax=Rhizobium rhizoryzae TaxID=451876 RepID=A0A7W6PR07_9HYPH|nr:anti-sigma factor [Rhizobium rhizoryzae]MBB4143429.1 anti-sigma-K factor RskA [Rhizobium rhizoryzae]
MTRPDQSEGDRARDEVLAGEYVLGVLPAEKRQQVEQRIRRDRAFAAMVARWQENLSSMDDEYTPQLPPDSVFPQVQQRLFTRGSQQAQLSGLGQRLWSSAPVWRTLALASFLMLIGVAIFGLQPPSSLKTGGQMQAQLKGQEGTNMSLLASYEPRSGRLVMTPVANTQAEPKSLQLWMIDGNAPPVSLGLMPEGANGDVIVPDTMRRRITNGVTLAVSLEPKGGSPSGGPTGPVLMSGQMAAR